MLAARVKFGVLPALNLKVRASGGTPKCPKTFKGKPPTRLGICRVFRGNDRRSLARGGLLPLRRRSSSPRRTRSDPALFERFARRTSRSASRNTPTCSPGIQYWHTTLDTSNPPFWKWFVGGQLNACYNCVDRHLAKHRNKAALIWVPEPEAEATQVITYQELYRRVNEFAALLQRFCGLQTGRPGHLPHADGPRAAGLDAGLRPARRHPLPGVRRVQRCGLRRPHR